MRDLIARKEVEGISPIDVFTAALYSPVEATRSRAAVELSKIQAPDAADQQSVIHLHIYKAVDDTIERIEEEKVPACVLTRKPPPEIELASGFER